MMPKTLHYGFCATSEYAFFISPSSIGSPPAHSIVLCMHTQILATADGTDDADMWVQDQDSMWESDAMGMETTFLLCSSPSPRLHLALGRCPRRFGLEELATHWRPCRTNRLVRRAANAAELARGVDDHVIGPSPVLQRHASLLGAGDYVARLCITVGP